MEAMHGSFVKTGELASCAKGIFWNAMQTYFFSPEYILFTNIKMLDSGIGVGTK